MEKLSHSIHIDALKVVGHTFVVTTEGKKSEIQCGQHLHGTIVKEP